MGTNIDKNLLDRSLLILDILAEECIDFKELYMEAGFYIATGLIGTDYKDIYCKACALKEIYASRKNNSKLRKYIAEAITPKSFTTCSGCKIPLLYNISFNKLYSGLYEEINATMQEPNLNIKMYRFSRIIYSLITRSVVYIGLDEYITRSFKDFYQIVNNVAIAMCLEFPWSLI